MSIRSAARAALLLLGILPVLAYAASLEIVAQYALPAPPGRGSFRIFGINEGYSPAGSAYRRIKSS